VLLDVVLYRLFHRLHYTDVITVKSVVTSTTEVVFSSLFVCLFVRLFVCYQLCAKASERICMKFSGNVGNEQMIEFWWQSVSWIQIHIAQVVRHALAEVCTVPVLLVVTVGNFCQFVCLHQRPSSKNVRKLGRWCVITDVVLKVEILNIFSNGKSCFRQKNSRKIVTIFWKMVDWKTVYICHCCVDIV